MKIHEAPPNSLEWLLARAGIPTASELDNLLTPKFKNRTGEMPYTYLAQKLAERWIGGNIESHSSLDMEFGRVLEEEAIPFYEITKEVKITRVGLILTDDGQFGASPDGIVGDDCGLEIKCPKAETHVKYLLNNDVPEQYLTQIHGGMFATGFSQWVFMSYHRRMPPLILTVGRDAAVQSRISSALKVFTEAFEDSWQRMIDINGGPPYRPTPFKHAPRERAPLHEMEVIP